MNRMRPRFPYYPQVGGFADTPAGAPAAIPAPIGAPAVPMGDIFDPMQNGMDVVFYTTLVQGLASTSPNGTSSIQIDAGVDFYWIATTYQADITGTAQTESSTVVPLVTLLINDTGSRKNLQNQATPLASMAGPGERPYRLLKPRLFRASSTINFTWASYVAAGTTYTNIYLTLHGFTKPMGT